MEAIKNVSTQRERSIVDKIEVRVPIDPSPVRVRAFNENGNPIIEISTGYSALTRMIVSGFVLSSLLNRDEFGNEYARYIANTYATGRIDGGKLPWEKAGLSVEQKEKLINNTKYFEIEHGNHIVLLWYVLAHEIAHHVLEHEYGDELSMQEIRRQEKEADVWATNALIRIGVPPAIAFPGLLYWYYLDEFGVKSEALRSHPPELKRIRWMLKKTIQQFDVWNLNERYFQKVPKESTIDSFNFLLLFVEKLISEQSNYGALKGSEQFDQCMKVMYERCLKECQEKYGYSLSLCENQLCNSEKSKKIWELRCKEILNGENYK